MNKHISRLPFCFLALILILAEPGRCQTPPAAPPSLDAKVRQQLIENIVRELRSKYVAPEKVKSIESNLRAHVQSGDYDKIVDVREFASTLTQHLRADAKDLHLFVTYDPALESALLKHPLAPSVDLQELPPTPEQLARLRQSNYGFHKVEVMRGNVGYLELRGFNDLNYSKDTAAAAMNFLANTDAVIIDLRDNPGGFINLEIFLASYFYGVDPVEWLSRYHRDSDVTARDWTLREVPGKRLQTTDLYILTSKRTGSAAEGFSFMLQQRKRARIVGENTSGAGYGNRETAIGHGLIFYVSVFRQFDPRTGRGWQEVGVQPDVAAPAEQALKVAHAEAVRGLAGKGSGEARQQQLLWLAQLLEFEAYGAKPVTNAVLESYTGKYYGGQITISLETGQLYFLGASGVKRKLHALAVDTFLVEDSSVSPESQARLRFVKDAAGKVTKLDLLVSDGRSFPRVKDPE